MYGLEKPRMIDPLRRFLPVLALLGILLLPPEFNGGLAAQEVPGPGEGFGRIAGRVVSPGHPEGLPRARVQVLDAGGTRVTDNTGAFEIGGLEPGSYTVSVRLKGFAATELHGVTVAESGTSDVFVLLTPAGGATGGGAKGEEEVWATRADRSRRARDDKREAVPAANRQAVNTPAAGPRDSGVGEAAVPLEPSVTVRPLAPSSPGEISARPARISADMRKSLPIHHEARPWGPALSEPPGPQLEARNLKRSARGLTVQAPAVRIRTSGRIEGPAGLALGTPMSQASLLETEGGSPAIPGLKAEAPDRELPEGPQEPPRPQESPQERGEIRTTVRQARAIQVAQALNPGRIVGSVLDQRSGEGLQAALVRVVNTDVVSVSDETGDFFTPPIAPGTYTLEVILEGYETEEVPDVVVEPNGAVLVRVALSADDLDAAEAAEEPEPEPEPLEGLAVTVDREGPTGTDTIPDEPAKAEIPSPDSAVPDSVQGEQEVRVPQDLPPVARIPVQADPTRQAEPVRDTVRIREDSVQAPAQPISPAQSPDSPRAEVEEPPRTEEAPRIDLGPTNLGEGAGRIAGRVVDASSGRPLPTAQVQLVGTDHGTLSDLNGRFRTPLIQSGTYSVRVTLLGYGTAQVDGIVVEPSHTAVVDVALNTEALEIEGITIEARGVRRTSSEAGLLARQRAAASVSDGVSAEQISRSPDSDAADAMTRVTGVSVVDDKFVVVRGLGERYSNTLLNGAELASPEPTKRIVPLDIFSASLLESVVTTKAATPDKPGSFAGGSVELKTKDFPEESLLEVSLSSGYNSLTTFDEIPFYSPRGLDWLAFDGDNRHPDQKIQATEAFAESLRNRWTPALNRVPPNLGIGIDWGGQVGEFDRALGYVLSFDYGTSYKYQPADSFAFAINTGAVPIAQESTHSTTAVDWGLLGNLSKRFGTGHQISLRNILTREAEEQVSEIDAFDNETFSGFLEERKIFQVRYIERTFAQSQLSGQHLFQRLGNSTLQWRVSGSYAGRDEPENRSLNYLRREDGSLEVNVSKLNLFWFRFLDDWLYSGQVDWSTPFSLFDQSDTQVKIGASYRLKDRDLAVELLKLQPPTSGPPDGVGTIRFDPEMLMSPENLGRNVVPLDAGNSGLPYQATDIVGAFYGMLDTRLFTRLRLVGGLRVEQWDLEVEPGGGAEADPTVRLETDYLWSGNLTYSVTDAMNFRLAGYRTVSRPDPREIAPGFFVPVAGECQQRGNSDLNRTTILNGDVRWEWFPNPGELVSLSGFYKDFDDPVVQAIRSRESTCEQTPRNAVSARNIGAEMEVRKNLGFLADALTPFSVAGNLTLVEGDVTGNGLDLPVELELQDQSGLLLNGSLLYQSPDESLTASALVNYFSDRVTRYGIFFNSPTGERVKTPDVVERGRTTLDMKLSKRFGDRLSISLSGRNLTNERGTEIQETDVGPVIVGLSERGITGSLSLSYRIR